MKNVCCIDCEHCYDELHDDDCSIWFLYYCDAGSVMIGIEDPEKMHDCADFKQLIDDI